MIIPTQLADFFYIVSTSALRMSHTRDYGVSRGEFAGTIQDNNGNE
jgi:hypothetical protein